MKFFIFSFFILINSSAADDCEIISYSQIYKINRMMDESIIKNSTCGQKIQKHFTQLITNANGKLNANYLKHYFKQEFSANVAFTPKTIEVKSLKSIIHSSLRSKSIIVSEVSSLHSKSAFTIEGEQSLHISCKSCNAPGNKNIQIKIGPQSYWISAKLAVKRAALRATRNLSNLTPILLKDDFIETISIESGHTKYFTDIENIKYYKINKHIGSGDLIKLSDVYPKKLVNFGQKVKITIRNKRINLKTIGIAKKAGKLGDYIEIENPKTRKIVIGKVIDFNKVLVEL